MANPIKNNTSFMDEITYKLSCISFSACGAIKTMIYALSAALFGTMSFLSQKTSAPLWAVQAIVFAMIADTLTGIIAASRCGEKIKSMIGIAGLLEKLYLLIVIGMVGFVLRFVGLPAAPAATGAMGVLFAFEGLSIIGNIQSARKRERVEEQDAMTVILKLLRSLFSRLIKKVLNKLK